MANKHGRPMIGKRKLTQTELNRRHSDKICSIDAELDKMFEEIDWERRSHAEESMVNWVKTYCVPLLLNDMPPQNGDIVLEQMEHTITAHEKFMICLSRGSGKTSWVECATLYAIATGIQKFVVIVSANQRSSTNILKDLWRAVNERGTAFAQDYPEVTGPFHIANGSLRRRQLYHGISTDLEHNASELVFARLKKLDGTEYPTSGSLISCRGISGGIRGMKRGNLRPTYVIIDDAQTAQDARNEESVSKLMEAINKDIIPLAGKERLSILNCATPICVGDLVEKIKEDPSWKTMTFPAIISMPSNMGLWDEYFQIWDKENVTGLDHGESLKFYDEHRQDMDSGVQVFNPTRFSEADGHRSMIQKLLELKHTLGEATFNAEYQMKPAELEYMLPITPKIVASRISQLKMCEVPEQGVQCIVASSDLNLSKAITTTIVCFNRNQTASVIYHKFRKCSIPINLPESDYKARVYDVLAQHGKELKQIADQYHFKIDAWSIDANGTPWDAVLSFCKNSMQICGIPACGFVGRASHLFRPFVSSRLKEAVSGTVLCGDKAEREKRGTGTKWVYFDSDAFHEQVQKAFLAEVGNIGSMTWYEGGNHIDWSIQVCNEKLMMKKSRQDGTVEYSWRDNGDHDALDSIGQALATYASLGYPTWGSSATNMAARRLVPVRPRRKVRFA